MVTQNQKNPAVAQNSDERSMSANEIRYLQIQRVANFIWFVFGILEGLIGIRILLKLIGANPSNPFASFIYNTTKPFLAYFEGLTNNPSFNSGVLELHSLIAVAVYSLLSWIIVRFVWLIFYRPEDTH